MGSATREATAALRDTLAQQGATAGTATGEELFAVARLLDASPQLRNAVADPTAEPAGKVALVDRAFSGKVGAVALAVLKTAVQQRWSTPTDIIDGLEEAGVRVLAADAPASVSIADELFVFGGAVTSDAQLELALRSKLADPAAKARLVERLLDGKASEQTIGIARQLVLLPRGRSIRESLRWAAQLVADQSGKLVATVVSATALPQAQLDRLGAALAARYGKPLDFNLVIDSSLIGGLRVQIGDDVIDSSIATRLNDVRLQLA